MSKGINPFITLVYSKIAYRKHLMSRLSLYVCTRSNELQMISKSSHRRLVCPPLSSVDTIGKSSTVYFLFYNCFPDFVITLGVV